MPDGIAHFLEHKMFEEEDGDIFLRFSSLGASANAYTTFERTTYLFSCTENVEENLTTLLDFVQRPYFTDQNVEKEKGIIAQEIRMYDDDPEWRAYFGLLQGLYHRHPVRTEIAGTVESIQTITKELLYTCYETFYHPSNMALFVVGPVDPGRILSLVAENQAKKTFDPPGAIRRFYPEEPDARAKPASRSPCRLACRSACSALRTRPAARRATRCSSGSWPRSSSTISSWGRAPICTRSCTTTA